MNSSRLALRLLGLGVGLALGLVAGNAIASLDDSNDTRATLQVLVVAIGGIGYLVGPHLSWAIVRNIRRAVTEASAVDIVAIGIGIAFGAVVSAAFALPLSYLPDPFGVILPLIVAVVVCSFSIFVVLLRKRDLIAPWIRSKSAKPAAAAAPAKSTALLLDTNVLIDGRIGDVVGTGFLTGPFMVPRFVLDELQHIADSEDPARRVRGRRGLDVLNKLQADHPGLVKILDEQVPEEREVDAKLVRLAKAHGNRVLTNDFNLNRVAQIQGVQVLNFNELTNALRPIVLPGEEISLKVVQEGREAGQGVGFLDDGTMVVVDGGRTLVGSQIAVTVTRLLQTGAGRMVFATPKHAGGS